MALPLGVKHTSATDGDHMRVCSNRVKQGDSFESATEGMVRRNA